LVAISAVLSISAAVRAIKPSRTPWEASAAAKEAAAASSTRLEKGEEVEEGKA